MGSDVVIMGATPLRQQLYINDMQGLMTNAKGRPTTPALGLGDTTPEKDLAARAVSFQWFSVYCS